MSIQTSDSLLDIITTVARKFAEAISLLPGASAFSESLQFYEAARAEVVKLALLAISDGDTVILDAGSTAYLIANGLLSGAMAVPRRVVTSNLAVSLCLAGSEIPCTQLGGVVDDLHLCTIVTPKALDLVFASGQLDDVTYVLSAAACRIDGDGLWIRARRPDQFPLKQALVARCATVVLAVEAAKFSDPFDGLHDFQLARRPLTVLTDSSIHQREHLHNQLVQACSVAGYSLSIGAA